MGRSWHWLTVALLLLAAALQAPSVARAGGVGVYTVEITPNGLVVVSFNTTVEPGLNPVPLPVEPLEATIEAVVNGVRVPPLYVNGTLYIPAESGGSAFVTYNGRVRVAGGVLSFNITGGVSVELLIPSNVVLLSLPQNMTGYRVLGNGTLAITLTGPAVIEYTLKEIIAPGTVATQTPQQATTQAPQQAQATTPTTAMTTTTPTATHTMTPAVVALAIVALVAVAFALAAMRGRGGGASAAEEARPLTDTDKLILKALEEAGGEALQSDLQKATGLPKTTLWRRLKRLEEAGYVELKREGKQNRVRLTRKPG